METNKIFKRNKRPVIILDMICHGENKMSKVEELAKKVLQTKSILKDLVDWVGETNIDGRMCFVVRFKKSEGGFDYMIFNENLTYCTIRYDKAKIRDGYILTENKRGKFKIKPPKPDQLNWNIEDYLEEEVSEEEEKMAINSGIRSAKKRKRRKRIWNTIWILIALSTLWLIFSSH